MDQGAGSGLPSPVALSGLPLGAMGEGGGMGQTMSQDPTKGAMGAPKGDQNQMDPLLLQAIMAQMMGGMGAGLGNLSLTQGVGGQSLGQFGVPFGGMGAPQGAVAGPGQQLPGQGTADPFSQIKSILGGISSLSRLAGGLASPTTDDQRGDTGGQSLSDQLRSGAGGVGMGDIAAPGSGMGGPGASLGSGGGTLGGQSSPLPMVGDLPPEQFAALLQSGLTPQQISAFMGGANLAPGQVSGGELGIDFGGSLGSGGGGGTLGQMGTRASTLSNADAAGGGMLSNLGAGSVLSGLTGLFNLTQDSRHGNLINILRDVLGLAKTGADVSGLTGLLGPSNTSLATAGGLQAPPTAGGTGFGAGSPGAQVSGGEMATGVDSASGAIDSSMMGSLAASGVPIAAIIMNMAMTGLSAAQRAQAGVSPAENAIDSLIDSMGIPGLAGVEGPIHTLFARQPNANERNAMDLGVAGTDLNAALPGIHAAGDPTELANSLFPLFEGRYNNQPYPILSGVGETDYNMGGPGMQKYPNIEQMAALFGGKDPNAVQFSWEQGVRPQDTATFANFLDQTVRDQMQLFQAAQSGDPMAQGLLQFYQQQNQARKADAQSRADQMYYSMNHQPPGDPTGA